jgi:hypothetical protein
VCFTSTVADIFLHLFFGLLVLPVVKHFDSNVFNYTIVKTGSIRVHGIE